jgi:hypothetical protein
MTRPVVLRSKTDVAVFIATLVIIAKRIASGFRCLLIEPTARENTSSRFNPHHSRASAAILDRLSAFETSLYPVIDVALAADIVGLLVSGAAFVCSLTPCCGTAP